MGIYTQGKLGLKQFETWIRTPSVNGAANWLSTNEIAAISGHEKAKNFLGGGGACRPTDPPRGIKSNSRQLAPPTSKKLSTPLLSQLTFAFLKSYGDSTQQAISSGPFEIHALADIHYQDQLYKLEIHALVLPPPAPNTTTTTTTTHKVSNCEDRGISIGL